MTSQVIAITNIPGCTTSDFGIAISIQYQVLDQSSTAIQSSAMRPQEKILNQVVNGIPGGDPEPNWVDMGPSGYPGTSQFTASNGRFLDAPFGTCASGSYVSSFTQPISVLVGAPRYTVRTNNWAASSSSANHGTITNSNDVSHSN